MFEYILSRVTGTHSKDIESHVHPSRRFIVGTLASRKQDSYSRSEDEKEAEEGTEEEGKASIRARRLKVSFLIDRGSISELSKLSVTVSGYVYYPFLIS